MKEETWAALDAVAEMVRGLREEDVDLDLFLPFARDQAALIKVGNHCGTCACVAGHMALEPQWRSIAIPHVICGIFHGFDFLHEVFGEDFAQVKHLFEERLVASTEPRHDQLPDKQIWLDRYEALKARHGRLSGPSNAAELVDTLLAGAHQRADVRDALVQLVAACIESGDLACIDAIEKLEAVAGEEIEEEVRNG